ncbi:beta-lactamase family protein [Streptomyces sp. NBC_00257]|uniref:serine hydrolase domain-containing protein n=1 Tax=unclassified Streptomyces TaxID=2593676 RepID=UPI002254E0EE|nr:MULTISPECIES: serine hydrolase domain-containing protein [unclassified Streptomyces]WTB54996.1 beta-lactamase family protein [Streptomyces sp. NBC_00826]WTH92119.1 beta-lactamase family protein [Streptomyces sp. NBC_00825]WTI00848.1 beta-lactamase family protein [Streptomyces sp. NBC_00822]MCX4847238.1 beta-lactamase family protein [Streptomyces sp. NBC_00893]MCX4866381.1 beta-lactamase family protein [Streptomyces sp. NBC_00906]
MKHKRALVGALALAVALGVGGAALPGSAAATTTAAVSAGHGSATDRARLQEILQRLTTVDGAPGALAEVRDRRGSTVLTSGVADVESNAPVDRDSRFRIGSMTKMFTATTMLQLVGEHHVRLDAPVERYLPGVVRGHGNDGRQITVRQLLQHTSGLPDFLDYLKPQEVVANPLVRYDPRDLVAMALKHPRVFKPGTGWDYSNTNYLFAGLIIEKVTGNTYAEEVRERIIKPLHLQETYVPDVSTIPGPHPRGYAQPGKDAPLLDITKVDPSVGGAAGGMISSGTDLNRFLGALLRGDLLRPAELREMMKTRCTGSEDGRAYGLGLESRPLPGGGLYWGHAGDFLGYETMAGATVDGRRATVMVNLGPGGSDAQSDDIEAVIRTALSAGRPSAHR